MEKDVDSLFEKARKNAFEISKVISKDPEIAGAALLLCYMGLAETCGKDPAGVLRAGANTLIDKSLDIELGKDYLNPSKN